MPTDFPAGIDTATTLPTAADLADDNLDTKPHSTLHGDIGLAVIALETKVGIDDSADVNSLDSTVMPLGALDSTWELADDLEVGEGAGTSARMLVLPAAVDGGFVTVFQCKFEGDTYPRLVLVSDGSYYFGDGTFNPLDGAAPSAALSPRYVGGGGRVGLNIKGGGNNSAIVIDSSGNVLINAVRFIDGTVAIATSVAPPDVDLVNGEMAFWLDDTVGATALKIKGKDSAGTVRTATVPLS